MVAQKMGGYGVAEAVGADVLCQPAGLGGMKYDLAYGSKRKPAPTSVADEKPLVRLYSAGRLQTVITQNIDSAWYFPTHPAVNFL